MLLKNKLPFWIALNSYVEAIVSGVPPLSLPKAKAKPIKNLIAFGGTEQRNLPDNYIERQFIYMMDGSYLLTDLVPTYDCKIEMDFQTTTVPSIGGNFLGGRSSAYPAGLLLIHDAQKKIGFDAFSSNRYISNVDWADNTRYKYVFNNKVATVYQGTTTVATNTFTGTDANGKELCIAGMNDNGTVSGNNAGIYLYSFKMWNGNGELIADYIPAVQKGTVPVVGFYDTVSETFMTATSGTFAAGAEAVPTPDAPMDIICNNGVLTLSPNLTNYGDSSWKDGYFTTTGSIGLANPEQGEMYCETYYPVTAGDKYTLSFYYGGTTLPSNTWACFAFYDSSKNFISRTANSSSIAQNPKTYTTTIPSGCSYIRISLRTYKSTDNAVYDVQFEKGASATTYHPYGVYADGTVETINVHTKNLFDEQWNRNTGVSTQTATWGQVVYANGWSTSGLVPVKAGQQYTVSYNTTTQLYVFYYESDGTMQQSYDFTTATKKTFTVPAGATHIRLQVNKSTEAAIADLKTQLETGATATTHVPYFNGGTAVAEMLLSVGTYTDEQEVISGNVTRKIGVKVLDGTEEYTYTDPNTYGIANITSTITGKVDGNTILFMCSHFVPQTTSWSLTQTEGVLNGNNDNQVFFRLLGSRIPNLSAWTQYLADQYAAGTPVIVVYPLATATTESVTGQPMSTAEGDNTVEITQASMSGLELSVKYIKGA